MNPSRSHDITANRIAKKLGTEYNKGKGPDIKKPKIVVEVETDQTVKEGLRQLQGFRKAVYIAGSTQKALNGAVKATQNTTVGVMDARGNIVKRSSRKKR